MRERSLRHGDVVQVRSPSEILATLDDRATLQGVPFMSEMVQMCGRRFVVDKRADKICDTMYMAGSRELPDTVFLEDLRCDGSGHDGCQAECRIFWKEAWLRRVDSHEAAPPDPDDRGRAQLVELVVRNKTYPATPGDEIEPR